MSRSDQDQQIISTSTILILSGFLIGMTTGRFVGPELSPYLLVAGLSGFMAFIVLDLSSSRRSQAALKVEQAQMEERLDKHMSSLTSIGFSLEPVSSEEKSDASSRNSSSENSQDQMIAGV